MNNGVMATRWLITGGCGFIGTNLIRYLVHEGCHAIRVLDNLDVGSLDDLRAVTHVTGMQRQEGVPYPPVSETTCQFVRGDVLDESLTRDVARGVDVIVHLAASTGVDLSVADPRRDCLTNVIGTLNCLEAARHAGVPRFVFASSGAPAGEVDPPVHEEVPPHPVSPYGAGKLAGEGYCSAYRHAFGIDTVALRFANVYGPGSGHKNSVVAKFIRRAIEGQPLELFGDGQQTRDFIYIDDLVRAVLRAAQAERVGGEIFQIATSRETTVVELVDLLMAVLQRFGITDVEVMHGAIRSGDVRRNYAATSKAQTRLAWRAETSLEDGLLRTVAFFLDRQRTSRGLPE